MGSGCQRGWFLPDTKMAIFSHILTRSSLCVCVLLTSSRKNPSHAGSEPTLSAKSLSRVQLFATPWTAAHQAPLSMGCSRQEYWSGLPFPCPKDLLEPGIEPRFLALQLDSLLAEPPGKSLFRNKKLLETILGTNNSPTEQGGGEVLLGLDHLPWPITLKCLLLNIRIDLFFSS